MTVAPDLFGAGVGVTGFDGDLAARNSAPGVAVDSDTCRPHWYGDVMDFDIAVCALLRSDGAYP